MKKILSLFLALMLLVMSTAMAETAAVSKTITSPGGHYALDVPQDYFCLDTDVLLEMLTTPENQLLLAQILGLEDISQLGQYLYQFQQNNVLFVYTGDMTGNFSVQTRKTGLTEEMLVAWKDQMDAGIAQQYVVMGGAEEDIRFVDIQQINGRYWYGVDYELMGQKLSMRMTAHNGVECTLTFTNMDMAAIQDVLASFQVLVPAQ